MGALHHLQLQFVKNPFRTNDKAAKINKWNFEKDLAKIFRVLWLPVHFTEKGQIESLERPYHEYPTDIVHTIDPYGIYKQKNNFEATKGYQVRYFCNTKKK